MRVEEQLIATLQRVAEHPPAPPKDLLATVGLGHRRRRFTQAGVAAGVALAVAGAVALLPPGSASPPPPAVGTAPPAALPVPAEQLWPHAVHRIPLMSKTGLRNPLTMIDDSRLLVSYKVADRLTGVAVVDVRTGQERAVPGPGQTASAFTAHNGSIYWCESRSVWTVKADGTGKRLLTSELSTPCDRFVFADDALYISGRLSGQPIVRVPLAGGSHVQVHGTVDLQIWTWPWATTATATSSAQPEALNLVTGERRTPVRRAAGTFHWFATDGATWLGMELEDPSGAADDWRSYVVTTDASNTIVFQGFRGRTLNLGRFVGGMVTDDQPVVWDLQTGKVGTYGKPPLGRSTFDQQMDRPLAWWPTPSDTLLILDLALI